MNQLTIKKNQFELILSLPLEKQKEVTYHIINYAFYHTKPNLDTISSVVFNSIAETIEKQFKRSQNGKLGGRGNTRKLLQNNINNFNLDTWCYSLKNSQEIENFAKVLQTDVNVLINAVNDFKQHAQDTYPTYNAFIFHFKNWFNKQTTKTKIW